MSSGLEQYGWNLIGIYLIGSQLLMAVLMLANGRLIRLGANIGAGARAMRLLHGGYDRSTWRRNWELIENVKKLLFTSVLFTLRDERLALAAAFLLSAVSVALKSTFKPFADESNHRFGLAFDVALFLNVIVLILLKLDTDEHGVSPFVGALIDICLVLLLVTFVGWTALTVRASIYAERRLRALKWDSTDRAVSESSSGLPNLSESSYKYHVYLSHVEDASHMARTLRLQLQEMLPGLSCFMPPTDKASLEYRKRELAKAQVLLIYLTTGYFDSLAADADLKALAACPAKPLLLAVESGKRHGRVPLDKALGELKVLAMRVARKHRAGLETRVGFRRSGPSPSEDWGSHQPPHGADLSSHDRTAGT